MDKKVLVKVCTNSAERLISKRGEETATERQLRLDLNLLEQIYWFKYRKGC